MTTTTETIPTLDYLAWVARQIRLDGGFSGGKHLAYERQTWQRAIAAYDVTMQWVEEPNDEDRALARSTLAYFRSLDPADQLSDYLLDLVVLLRDDTLPRTRLALAASGVQVYQRQTAAQERRRDEARQRQTSTHLGRPGEALTVIATVAERHDRAGRMSIYKLVTDNGEVLTYFGPLDELNSGWVYRLNVRIGAHDAYRGEQRTKLRECRVADVIEQGSHAGPKVGG